MKISSYISTRTHYLRENFSMSLIYDFEQGLYYFFKGISSNLWDLIVKYQDISKLRLYADENNLNDELESLLFELKEKKLIETNQEFKKSTYNYLSKSINRDSENIDYFLDKWRNLSTKLGYIDSIILELTYNCNLKCKHCFNHKNMGDYYISFSDAKKVIDEAYELGVFSIRLTGGECSLNKDFLKICEYIRSKHLDFSVLTNGQMFSDNEDLYEKLVSLCPNFVQCSVYSMNPEVHDSITGVKNSFNKTINFIEKLKDTKIKVVIASPILSYNKDSYKEIRKYADSIGVKYRETCVFTNNPENNNLNSKLSFEELKQFLIHKFQNDKVIMNPFKKDDYSICEAGFHRLCITPKLDVTPCVAFYYKLGNLNSNTIKEIMETTLKDFRKMFIRKNLTECFNEEYCSYCQYCPDSAFFEGSFMKKNSILCENAKACYETLGYLRKKKKINEESGKI